MTDPQTIWIALIVAQAIVNAPFLLVLLKGNTMSDTFKAALDALVAAFNSKIAAAQNALDAANATIAQLQANVVVDTGPQVDAEDTAAVIAATPQ